VDKEELEDIKLSTLSLKWAQDYEAKFISGASEAFSHVEESFTLLRPEDDNIQSYHVIGYDPGQKQDPAGVIVLRTADGRVMEIERWSNMHWELQVEKVAAISRKWGHATVGFDVANVGSVLEGLLRKTGISIKPIEMNSAQVKNDLVLGLQIAFEQGRIKLPDYRATWSPVNSKNLYNELKWFEPKLTDGGKISYSAPKGFTDDLTIALCIANHLRMSGAGSNEVVSIIYDGSSYESDDSDLDAEEVEYKPIFKKKSDIETDTNRPLTSIDKNLSSVLHSKHPNIGKKIFGKRSIPSFSDGGGFFWR
jgi:hypothetical protein